jgi:hypothetical protein
MNIYNIQHGAAKQTTARRLAKREYPILGAKTLEGAWDDVTNVSDPDAAGYRFFTVKVRLK